MQRTLVGKLDQMDLFDELDRAFHQTLFEGVGMTGINATVLVHNNDKIIAIFGVPYEPGQLVAMKYGTCMSNEML